MGFSLSLLHDFSAYSPFISLLMISLPSACIASVFSIYYIFKLNLRTPARSLELNRINEVSAFYPQAKSTLDQIYSSDMSLKVMD